MDCKIVLQHQANLHCVTHQSESMSSLCAVAEQQLRAQIANLVVEVVTLQDQVDDLKAELKFVSGP